MKEMNLPPLDKYQYANCLHAIDLSMIYNYGLSYDRIFALYWGFRYTPDPKKEIENWIDRDGLAYTNEYSLAVMNGVSSVDCAASSRKELLQCIKDSERKNYAIVVNINLKNLPGQQGYAKIDADHYLVALGFTSAGELICHDPYHYHQTITLDRKVIEDLSLEFKIYSFSDHDYDRIITNKELMRQSAAFYLNKIRGKQSALSSFAKDLESNTDMAEKLSTITVPMTSIFFFKFNSLIMDRNNFLNFIRKTLDIQRDTEKTQPVEALAHTCAQKWRSSFLLLSKAMSKKLDNRLLIQTSKLLSEVAKYEFKLAEQLITYINIG